MSVSSTTSTGQNIWLPWTPSYSLWKRPITIWSINCFLVQMLLTQVLLNPDMSCLCKQCRPRSSVGFWRSQLIWICTIAIKYMYVNLYQQSGSSNLIGWKLEKGVASFYSAGQGLMLSTLDKYSIAFVQIARLPTSWNGKINILK